jgi:hypothetical protein
VDWQQPVALLIVAGAAGLLLWGKFRPRQFSFQRDTHCGCGGGGQRSGARPVIVYRARKGQRPEVLVKMK